MITTRRPAPRACKRHPSHVCARGILLELKTNAGQNALHFQARVSQLGALASALPGFFFESNLSLRMTFREMKFVEPREVSSPCPCPSSWPSS
eukprot:1312066-Rhodomonas_salina.2